MTSYKMTISKQLIKMDKKIKFCYVRNIGTYAKYHVKKYFVFALLYCLLLPKTFNH